MTDLVSNAFFPGVEKIISYSVTLGHGITPSVFELRMAPQQSFPAAGGTFTILAEGGRKISFDNCKVQTASYHFDESGAIVTMTIMDRRWMWAFGQVSGSYNLRMFNNKILKATGKNKFAGDAISDTEKTPQELATLCLADGMGEVGFDVADLPNDSRPTVQWVVENPARALAALCERLGCRVVLQLNGRVAIRVVGQGAQLPDGYFIDLSDAINPPQKPDSIAIATARVRWQYDFPLEAVGEDTNGKVQLLADLDYAPDPDADDGGFGAIDIGDFTELDQGGNTTISQLAKRSVYKWYRIELPDSFSVPNPTFGNKIQITKLEQILPIEDRQINTVVGDDGFDDPLSPWVFGVWFNENDADNSNVIDRIDTPENSAPKNIQVQVNFSLDKQQGIVKFSDPVRAVPLSLASTSWELPTLRLRIAFNVREPQTNSWIRYGRLKRIADGAGFGTQPLFIKADEIIPNIIASFNSYYTGVSGWSDNGKEVNQECDYYISAAEQLYQQNEPQTVLYSGIHAVELDGALQSITWTFGQDGAKTRISRNQDKGTPTTIPYILRRQYEKTAGSRDLAAQLLNPDRMLDTLEKVKVR